jgi:hypothetical protein
MRRLQAALGLLVVVGWLGWVGWVGAGCAAGTRETVVDQPPPRQLAEQVGSRPGYVWVKGNWYSQNGQWQWAAGHWEPERTGQVWRDGYWDLRGNRYYWVEGQWEEANVEVREHH